MMGEWKKVRLGDVAQIIGGGTPSRNEPLFWEGEIKWVTPTDVTKNNNKYLNNTAETITEEGLNKSAAKVIEKGNVLMTSRASIGKCLLNTVPVTTNQGFTNFIVDENIINNEFLYYTLIFNAQQFNALGYGSTLKEISKGEISSFNISIPNNVRKQQKIAAILSSVDEAIEKTEQIIEQTETVKKGLMQELLTKGIGHTEFKDTPVGTIPEEWEVLNFKDVFDRITTKNETDNQNVLTISGEHGLISQLEYFNKSVSSKNLKNYIYLESGDFAYNKSYSNGYPLGAIKRLDRYDVGVVSTLYICFRLKDPYINGFYKHYFDSPYWHRQVYSIAPEGGRSHGLLNVGVKDFFEILIPVPPIKEQEKIRKKIDSIDQKIIKEKSKLENLHSLKQGLMQQLLTGKKRVKVDDSEEVLP